MSQLIIDIIRLVINLIEQASKGDAEALKKLCIITPEKMQTELVARIQDELDAQKFGQKKIK